ncbi:hypothetical protein NXS19_000802 [Fusarium pseudograminearum]|nr:hypothetical protein NXS19_000802 [Fusarium pseudograminearum]
MSIGERNSTGTLDEVSQPNPTSAELHTVCHQGLAVELRLGDIWRTGLEETWLSSLAWRRKVIWSGILAQSDNSRAAPYRVESKYPALTIRSGFWRKPPTPMNVFERKPRQLLLCTKRIVGSVYSAYGA